jgi:phosphatidylethanolamine-binding protein (PEBP) family uncharacterized protein
MSKMRKLIFSLVLFHLFVQLSCSEKHANNDSNMISEKGKFRIDYSWRRINMCRYGISPRISLINVPQGTVTFFYRVTDLDLTTFNHGYGNIKFKKGSTAIKSGAFKHYYGPCPPPYTTHQYSIKIIALDSHGNILAEAEKVRTCSYILKTRKVKVP